jgi:hypothetical protein
MGQVWFKANCDGINEAGFRGGRGSAFAVTAQNPGADGLWNTDDDLEEPLNQSPTEVTIDWTPTDEREDSMDRVRGFFSYHLGGSVFGHADASTHFVAVGIDAAAYRSRSTRAGGEVETGF